MWGSCFWSCTSVRLLPSSRHPSAAYTHTQLTYTQLTHTPLTHTPLTHTPLTHTQLTHTHTNTTDTYTYTYTYTYIYTYTYTDTYTHTHTLDKKWSFIGSVGNWIPYMQNQTRPRTKGVRYEVFIGNSKDEGVKGRTRTRSKLSIQSSAFWNRLKCIDSHPYNQKNSRQIAKAVQKNRVSGCRLSRMPYQRNCWNEDRKAGTWLQRPRVISVMNAALFVGQSAANMRLPPCVLDQPKKFYICSDVPHTHTPRHAGSRTEVPAVRWRWGWQGNESEMRMKMGWKLLNRNTRRVKRRGGTKKEHQHQHTLPGAGEPWKGKGKEKAKADGRKPRPAEGGGRTRLNQPNPSENETYLSTHGTRPTWNGGARMK